ncbi:MAG: hypothetical protein COB22_06765 [Cycloclasticus sp.]|nr:MAG: hypothetical protein COB22_06765 [Cycloclasticus sp.]
MSIKTTKPWPNYLLLLLLVTAFLTMQSATAHIHLGEQHNHDETHHQHQAEIHAHNLATQTTVVADSHQESHANVIVLIHECSIPKQEKQKNLSTALIAKSASLLQPFLLVNIKIPEITNAKLSYFSFSTVNPRAPPQTS